MRLLVILVALALAYLGFLWLAGQSQKTKLQIAAVLTGAALIALAATGRLSWIFAAIGALLPFLRRLLSLLGYFPVLQRLYRQFQGSQSATGRSSGRQSSVESRFFRMTLDHDSGSMDGRILEGRFADRQLSDLSFDELRDLLLECGSQDQESAALLRAYLSREHSDQWQQHEESAQNDTNPGFSSAMTFQEAYAILGLAEGADHDQVRQAHRKLMQKLHPDHGGSTFLAAKINQAKDLLLSRS